MKLRILSLSLLSLILFYTPVNAGLPSYTLKFKNINQKRKAFAPLIQDWEFYVKDHEQILYNKPSHKFKNDQFCSFSFDLNEKQEINKQSIKLLEHKENYTFNLAALDFLQNISFHFKKTNPESPITIELSYKAY